MTKRLILMREFATGLHHYSQVQQYRTHILDPLARDILQTAKVARLATSDENQPHLVPVVFVFDGRHIYIPIDEKKKKTNLPGDLKRIKNIRKNPKVAFLIDRYDDDWTKLYFIMIMGKASILPSESCRKAIEKLVVKYPQYQTIKYGNMCIRIKPERLTIWQNL